MEGRGRENPFRFFESNDFEEDFFESGVGDAEQVREKRGREGGKEVA